MPDCHLRAHTTTRYAIGDFLHVPAIRFYIFFPKKKKKEKKKKKYFFSSALFFKTK